jgi:thioredoxin reductase (NADPH)
MKNNRKLEQNVKYYLGWNLIGSPYSDGLEIEDIKTKSRLTIPFDYILVQYGYKFSNSKSLFKKIKTKNERILVDKKTQKTNIENIFACGDCCTYKGKEFTIKSGFDEIDRLKLK